MKCTTLSLSLPLGRKRPTHRVEMSPKVVAVDVTKLLLHSVILDSRRLIVHKFAPHMMLSNLTQ